MKPTKYIWMDGTIVPWKDAHIHILSHALHHGSGAFEGIRFYATAQGSALFRLDDHLERLKRSWSYLYEKMPYRKKQLTRALVQLIKKNDLHEGYVRIIVSLGYKALGVSALNVPAHLAIAVYPWDYIGKKSVRVKTSSLMRLHPSTARLDGKITGQYVNALIAGREAKKLGYDEALLLDYRGYVAEGPAENIFMVKNNMLYTPLPHAILPGITRDTIITLAKDHAIRVVEKNIRLTELYGADECFFTGTAIEIVPILSIDKKKIGTGRYPVTELLRKEYLCLVQGTHSKYNRWLTPL